MNKKSVPFTRLYSFLRDRIRAVRVDLHVQQPRSTTTGEYILTHECSLRFEILANMIAKATYVQGDKYDEKLAMKAISQTVEPLLHAYRACRQRKQAIDNNNYNLLIQQGTSPSRSGQSRRLPFISHSEPAVRRFVLLLQIEDGAQLFVQLAKLPPELLDTPQLTEAIAVFTAFRSKDWTSFLAFYKKADLLSAICLSATADFARYSLLASICLGANASIGDQFTLSHMMDKLSLSKEDDLRAQKWLEYLGLQVVVQGSGSNPDTTVVKIPPRKELVAGNRLLGVNPQSGVTESLHFEPREVRALLQPFYELYGIRDPMLQAKHLETGLSRTDIIIGRGDPGARP